jgi:hypothetical protein
MIYGLTAFSMLVYLLLRAIRGGSNVVSPLIPFAMLACGIAYPLLYPSTLLIVGLFAPVVIAVWRTDRARSQGLSPIAIGTIAAGCVFSAVLVGLYILFLRVDAVKVPLAFNDRGSLKHSGLEVLLMFITTGVLVSPALWRSFRLKAWPELAPVSACAGLFAGFVIFSMPTGVQYKFLAAAMLLLAPLAAGSLGSAALSARGERNGLLALLATCLILTTAALVTIHVRVPNLKEAFALDESVANVRPLKGWADGWMRAVAEHTSADTILIDIPTTSPTSVFTDRAGYVVPLPTYTVPLAQTRPGYTMSGATILQDVKSYPGDVIKARQQVVEIVFRENTSPASIRLAAVELANLHRPIAIHFVGPSAFLGWLQAASIGQRLFDGPNDVVWFIGQDAWHTL